MTGLNPRITVEAGKMGGKPCIRGLRFTVYDLASYLASGMSEEQILREFPDLEKADFPTVYEFFASIPERLAVLEAARCENLPPAAAIDLADLFPESIHVRSVGLASVADGLIWEFAREHGYVFITKDKDFANLSLARGAPPKVILIQTGNCSVEELLSLMRRNSIRFAEFDDDPHRALLVLR